MNGIYLTQDSDDVINSPRRISSASVSLVYLPAKFSEIQPTVLRNDNAARLLRADVTPDFRPFSLNRCIPENSLLKPTSSLDISIDSSAL